MPGGARAASRARASVLLRMQSMVRAVRFSATTAPTLSEIDRSPVSTAAYDRNIMAISARSRSIFLESASMTLSSTTSVKPLC